jgi:hypothetical protein
MPQEDNRTNELNHPEEIRWVVFTADDHATMIMKPSDGHAHFASEAEKIE